MGKPSILWTVAGTLMCPVYGVYRVGKHIGYSAAAKRTESSDKPSLLIRLLTEDDLPPFLKSKSRPEPKPEPKPTPEECLQAVARVKRNAAYAISVGMALLSILLFVLWIFQ